MPVMYVYLNMLYEQLQFNQFQANVPENILHIAL